VESYLTNIFSTILRTLAKFSPELAAKFAWSFFCRPIVHKRPTSKLESNLLEQASKFYVDSNEYRIAAYEWEPEINSNSKKTILLTHGWAGYALNFAHVIQHLLSEGYNVLAYDGPAHGNSSGKHTTLLHNTRALLDVVKHRPHIDALIGHSFGAMTNAYAIDLAQESSVLSSANKVILIAGPNKLTDIFASFTTALKLPESILNIFFRNVEALTGRKIENMATANFLKHYSGQVLVIHDNNDRVVPHSEAQSVADDIPCKLFTTSGYGHGRILACKDALNEISDHLQTN